LHPAHADVVTQHQELVRNTGGYSAVTWRERERKEEEKGRADSNRREVRDDKRGAKRNEEKKESKEGS
jgi:hypothetical protein